MTEYSDTNSQFDSPVRMALGHGYANYEDVPVPSTENRSEYSTPIVQILGWGFVADTYSSYIVDGSYLGPPQLSPDYPFTLPSADIKGLIVDLYFSFDDPRHIYEAPFRVHRFQCNATNDYYIQIKDANDLDVFNSYNLNYTENSTTIPGDTYLQKAAATTGECIYRRSVWGRYYTLLYWETDLVTLKAIVHTPVGAFDITPENGDLDARALYQYPDRVRSIKVISGESSAILTAGKLIVRCGYNMAITPGERTAGVRPTAEIGFTAQAGAGLGVIPSDCECDTPLTSINGVTPNADGSFFIPTDGCQYTKGVTTLTIGNDCTPCCACEDMTTLGNRYDAISNNYYCAGGKATAVRNKLIDAINRMQQMLDAQPNSSCMLEYLFLQAQCPLAVFKVVVKNTLCYCIQGVQVTIQIPGSVVPFTCRKTDTVVREYSSCYAIEEVPYNPTASGSLTVYFTGPIPPGEQVYASGIIRHSGAEGTVQSSVTSASYYVAVEADRRAMAPCTIIGGEFESPGCADDSAAYDPTKDVSELENEIREICTDNNYDAKARQNNTDRTIE